jgi:hypothetical protein
MFTLNMEAAAPIAQTPSLKAHSRDALEQFVGDESFRSIALGIDKGDMVIDFADSLQLVCVAMVVRTSINTTQEDGDMDPREAEEIELELVHVGRFAIE